MKKIVKQIITVLLVVLSPWVWAVAPASAQTGIDLAVSPPTAYLKIKQGSSATHTIVIENLSEQPLKISPKVVDFSSDNKTGVPILSEKTTFPYFDFDAESLQTLDLPPHGKAQLALKISVPSGVPNQEFPMSVLFESQPNTDFSMVGVSSQVRGVIGSNLIVLVSSEADVSTKLDITSFKTSGIVDSFRPLRFTPVLSNTGYAAAAASGSAQIINWQGKVIKEYPIRPIVVLANSSRELETNLTAETYTTKFYYKPLILLGVYKLSVDLTIQNQDQPVHILQTKHVLAIPISIIVVLLLIPLCWWIYTYFLRKS